MTALGRPSVVEVALVAALLSGCTESGPKTEGPPVTVDKVSGGIVGYVTDDQYLPLAKVAVRLATKDETVETDATGAFAFSNVEPGSHDLSATAGGYETGAARVKVVAGEVSDVMIPLRSTRVSVPHKHVLKESGTLGCGTSFTVAGQPGEATPCTVLNAADPEFNEHQIVWNVQRPPADWTELVLEMKWTPSQGLLGKGLRMEWDLAGCHGLTGYRFAEGQGESVLSVSVRRETIRAVVEKANDTAACADGPAACGKTHCNLTSRVLSLPRTTQQAVDVGVTVQQDFEQYLTVFLRQAAPKGYSAFAS